jgi:protein O-GlcNAc transferase
MSSTSAQDFFLEGWRLHQQGKPAEARARYALALEREPRHFDALHLSGIAAGQLGDLAAMAAMIGDAATVQPGNPLVHFNHGAALERLARADDALAAFDRAIALKPDYAEAYHSQANILDGLGRLALAIASYARAANLSPEDAGLRFQYGCALRRAGDAQAALMELEAASRLNPGAAEIHLERGIALWALARAAEALEAYDQAVALTPSLAEAHINRGVALRSLGRLFEALTSLDKAVALKPDHAGAHNNRGAALMDAGDYAAAVAAFDRAIALNPAYADAFNNRAVALDTQGRYDAALASAEEAIRLKPDHADAHVNKGNILKSLQRMEAAADSYAKALELKPDSAFLRGTLLHARMQICDWTTFDAEVAALCDGVLRGEKITPSFPLVAVSPSAAVQKRAAEIWAGDKAPANPALGPLNQKRAGGKIRVGYFSADFRYHPVAAQAVEMFEAHDRAKFEIFAFSFGPETGDSLRMRLRSAFHSFIDVRGRNDRDITALAREYQLDVAVDLSGYTSEARTGIFAMRAAPIQIAYLGYPGTMGVDYIDYIIGDDVVIPPGSEAHYSEKVIRLPCFMPSDTRRVVGPAPTRAEMGLPEGAFVFCAFNNAYKITPPCFARWVRILGRVEDSVLWLSANTDAARRNLRAAATRGGVDPARLVFANRVPGIEVHLARHQLADLFLDTAPYNAHSTACDALYAGLPVLTLAQDSYASRVAASLLTAAGLTEMVTRSEEAYETLAAQLAADAALLASLKKKLARRSATLFDVAGLTRHLENAYSQAVARAHAGLPPAHITAASH